jgi:hypothetical protein
LALKTSIESVDKETKLAKEMGCELVVVEGGGSVLKIIIVPVAFLRGI